MYRKPWPRPDQAKAQPNPAQAKALAFGLACDVGKPKPFKARTKPSHLAWPVILESPSPSKPGQSPQSQAKPGPNNTTDDTNESDEHNMPDMLADPCHDAGYASWCKLEAMRSHHKHTSTLTV